MLKVSVPRAATNMIRLTEQRRQPTFHPAAADETCTRESVHFSPAPLPELRRRFRRHNHGLIRCCTDR
jgi:hypothetical protein